MDTTHWIYVIATQDGQEIMFPVKVGITSNPNVRLVALQTASPVKLVLYKKYALPSKKIAKHVEHCFHCVKSENRIRGEWFNLSPDYAANCILVAIRAGLQTYTDFSEEEIALALAACVRGGP